MADKYEVNIVEVEKEVFREGKSFEDSKQRTRSQERSFCPRPRGSVEHEEVVHPAPNVEQVGLLQPLCEESEWKQDKKAVPLRGVSQAEESRVKEKAVLPLSEPLASETTLPILPKSIHRGEGPRLRGSVSTGVSPDRVIEYPHGMVGLEVLERLSLEDVEAPNATANEEAIVAEQLQIKANKSTGEGPPLLDTKTPTSDSKAEKVVSEELPGLGETPTSTGLANVGTDVLPLPSELQTGKEGSTETKEAETSTFTGSEEPTKNLSKALGETQTSGPETKSSEPVQPLHHRGPAPRQQRIWVPKGQTYPPPVGPLAIQAAQDLPPICSGTPTKQPSEVGMPKEVGKVSDEDKPLARETEHLPIS